MSKLQKATIVEQVASHLREEIGQGRWKELMPGRQTLARDLGISAMTVVRALALLEREGLLIPQGNGLQRKIRSTERGVARKLRIGILAGELADLEVGYVVELQHEIEHAGHSVSLSRNYLLDPKMTPARLERLIDQNTADAWIVIAAPRETLEWLVARGMPVLAIFGRRRGLPIAGVGPDKTPALLMATRKLIELGHRGIVLLNRRMRRMPTPGIAEKAFLEELAASGIAPSSFHLPDWEEDTDGFHCLLENLFKVTPPTALIIDEVPLFIGVQQFLASRKILVPDQVSLVCNDASQDFQWCRPSVAHIHWDSQPIVRRAVKWAANVALGRRDVTQTLTPAKFVTGGTIAPPPGR